MQFPEQRTRHLFDSRKLLAFIEREMPGAIEELHFHELHIDADFKSGFHISRGGEG